MAVDNDKIMNIIRNMSKRELLQMYFGHSSLKLEQEEIIDAVLAGIDSIGLLPTGFGKSITFQIPALLLDGVTIVITPLISLMQDQVRILKSKSIKAEYINSLQTEEEQEIIYKRINNGKVKILYVSAERLLTKKFKERIKSIKISLVVCDEAHTLLWSEDFRYSLGKIFDFICLIEPRPKLLALTATATNNTIEKIKTILRLRNPKIVIGDCDRKNIFYSVINTSKKDVELIKYIKNNNTKGIVYCLTIKSCEHVHSLLISSGIKSSIYHGQMDSKDKMKIQNEFTKGEVMVMVCTNAFGMGIDIPNIRYVVEYELPSSIEDFSQQTGRASRDGEYAEAIVLFDKKDIRTSEYFIDNIKNENVSSKELKVIKQNRYERLDKMIMLCLSRKCIHQQISNYFGIQHKGKCNMCCNCKKQNA